jgi:hypothetical protein
MPGSKVLRAWADKKSKRSHLTTRRASIQSEVLLVC